MVYVCSRSRAGEDGAAPGTAPHLPTGCVHVPGPCPCPCRGAMSLSWGHAHVLGAAGAGVAVPALGRPSQQPLTHHCCGWLCSWFVNIDRALKTIVFLFFFGFLQPPSGPAPVALCAAHWGLWGTGLGLLAHCTIRLLCPAQESPGTAVVPISLMWRAAALQCVSWSRMDLLCLCCSS